MSDYSKHWPWYAKVSRGRNWQKLMCKTGRHIPVKCYHRKDHPDPEFYDIFEVFCQECAKDLLPEEWNKFWKGT
jgi:hypothetical protein